MKHIRILTLLLALVLLCTGCAAGGAAEPRPSAMAASLTFFDFSTLTGE